MSNVKILKLNEKVETFGVLESDLMELLKEVIQKEYRHQKYWNETYLPMHTRDAYYREEDWLNTVNGATSRMEKLERIKELFVY